MLFDNIRRVIHDNEVIATEPLLHPKMVLIRRTEDYILWECVKCRKQFWIPVKCKRKTFVKYFQTCCSHMTTMLDKVNQKTPIFLN